MKKFYISLSEKHRRRYAAIESEKLDHGGVSYISKILGCSRETIYQGLNDIKNLPEEEFCDLRIRNSGGGRKTYEEKFEKMNIDLDVAFLDVLKDNIAGDPMNGDIIWTKKTRAEICQNLEQKHNIDVSETVVKQLLKKHNLRQRKIQKRITMKAVVNRNEQFEQIAKLKEQYQISGNPVISIDTKKKKI